jgi:hypothetical protein
MTLSIPTRICIERHYAECRVLFSVMLSVVVLNVPILNGIKGPPCTECAYAERY